MEKAFIAAIAGSAGSQSAMVEFFEQTPHDEVSYVVLRHLPAGFRSQLKAILARHSSLAIMDIRHGMVVKQDSIYIAPPGKYVTIQRGFFTVRERHDKVNRTADVFMSSLAEYAGRRAIGVILGGLLADGSEGVRRIQEAQGMTLAQEPSSCLFPCMPERAIGTGFIGKVAAIDEMPGIIREYVSATKEN